MDSYKKVLLELLTSNYDTDPTKNEQYAEQLISVHEQFVKRNAKLTQLLTEYIQQRNARVKTNSFFKKFTFWTFISLLVLLTISVSIVFVNLDFDKSNISSLVSVLSVSATYLTSILSIFSIMSKYLFPCDEEKDAIGMIGAVINNDLKVEEIMTKAIDENKNSHLSVLERYYALHEKGAITDVEFTSK